MKPCVSRRGLVRYFIWDALESIVHFSEVGFVVHGKSSGAFLGSVLTHFPGVACLAIFTFATASDCLCCRALSNDVYSDRLGTTISCVFCSGKCRWSLARHATYTDVIVGAQSFST